MRMTKDREPPAQHARAPYRRMDPRSVSARSGPASAAPDREPSNETDAPGVTAHRAPVRKTRSSSSLNESPAKGVTVSVRTLKWARPAPSLPMKPRHRRVARDCDAPVDLAVSILRGSSPRAKHSGLPAGYADAPHRPPSCRRRRAPVGCTPEIGDPPPPPAVCCPRIESSNIRSDDPVRVRRPGPVGAGATCNPLKCPKDREIGYATAIRRDLADDNRTGFVAGTLAGGGSERRAWPQPHTETATPNA